VPDYWSGRELCTLCIEPQPIPAYNHGMQVTVNTTVTLLLFTASGASEQLTLHLVADGQAEPRQGFNGISAPMSRAILGHSEDETIAYTQGDITRIYILSVAPLQSTAPQPSGDVLQAAMEGIQHTNMVLFASSYSSKWGDYDPDVIDRHAPPPPETEKE